ncbi:MAG: ATP-binding protein [Verrucomicrobiales bacterium]|nr:ATP-binding protein [Verrucomicrobiales bacterium]
MKLTLAILAGLLVGTAANLLRPWCAGGTFGKLFDGQSNVSLTGPVAHFELGRLAKASEDLKSVVLFLLLNVTRQHLLSLPRALRKRVVIEEVRRLLCVPDGEAILRELFEQFRKFNVQCIMVAQQISQLESESLRTAVLGNVRMAFIFNPGDAKDLDRLAEHLPLSEAAKAMILRYPTPDQLRGTLYSECCYLHLTAGEPYCGTIRFIPLPES